MAIKNEKPAVGGGGRSGNGGKTVQHIYFSTQGKPVATLHGQVLKKRVRASVHQLRKPAGWAIDRDILRKAQADGARLVEVEDAESGTVYMADIRLFDLFGIAFNRGFGNQVALPLQYWRVEAAGARQLALWEG